MTRSSKTAGSSPALSIQCANTYRIPTADGLCLGASIARPTGRGRYPALVWYDPYRSGSDGNLNDGLPGYFARHGYAFVYLNARGTGNSEGFTTDEYTLGETRDCVDAIAWLAEQPWCSGRVGMLGASYSAFTALQTAAMAPPALDAIAPAYFTDQRYTDDCHYKGGCLRGFYDVLCYGHNMVHTTALPPYPEAVGPRWSEIWRERLERNEPYLLKWLAHPTEDAYWSVGSIADSTDRIRAATLLIAGANDGYLNPPLRIFRKLQCPKRLLFGPWSHALPHVSHCGPRIDYGQILLRWWDRWLKDIDNGVDREAPVQVYERNYEPPAPHRTVVAGEWRAADDLPDGQGRVLYLADGALLPSPPARKGAATVPYLPAASTHGGLWDAGTPFCQPGEQGSDCARAVNFTTPPLTRDLHLFGNATFHLFISAEVPVIPVAARLCEVNQDGSIAIVTRGILNATRRGGMSEPQPLEPGAITEVAYHFEASCWKFAKGNRILLSVNGSDFPNVWPTPYAGDLTFHWGPQHPARISLPVWRGGRQLWPALPDSPDAARSTNHGAAPWQIIHDVLEDRYRLRLGEGREFAVHQRDPAVAWARNSAGSTMSWPGCEVLSEATTVLSSDARTFRLSIALNVRLNGAPFFQRSWSETFERHQL